MISLILDTETTGLYERNLPLTHPDQPDIIQFCGWLDKDGKVLSTVNVFIHGEKEIGEKAYEAHRIDRDMTAAIGISRRRLCYLVDDLVKKADVIVGHNIDFDINMLLIAMQRENGSGVNIRSKAHYCTMKNAVDVCRIPHPERPGQYKWPNLTEAYKALVDPRGFDGAHDAENDVRASHAIYNVLRSRSV